MQIISTPASSKQLINRQIVLADRERTKAKERERKNNNILHNKHIRRFVALRANINLRCLAIHLFISLISN